MNRKLLSLVVIGCVLSGGAFGAEEKKEVQPALEPVIVTATRTPLSEEKIGKSASVVTGEEIELAKNASFIESLRQLPGVRVQQLGGPGTFGSVRLRGLRTIDTQMLVNGLPFRDAADPQGSADGLFQDFLLDNWAQIELVRGSSATLYGSDSVGGTLNLLPKKTEGKPSLSAGFEGGSLQTFKQTYSLSGGEKALHYLGGFTRYTSEGIDSNDDYENNSYTAYVDFAPVEKIEAGFNFNAANTRLDLNAEPVIRGGEVVTVDDPNDFREADFFNYGSFITYHAAENWDHTIRFGAVDVNRKFHFKTDPDGSDFPSDPEFYGNTYNLEYQTNLQWDEHNLITFGYEHEREEMKQIAQDFGVDIKEKFAQYHNDWFLQDQVNLFDETLFVTGGIRITDHETVGTDVNGEGSIAYLIPDWGTKLHSHLGTGFRAPSLFELGGASTFGGVRVVFGNRDLDPEESLSWDIGVEQKFLDDKGTAGVTYFRQDFDNFIEFGSTGYINVDGAVSQGIETEVKYQILPELLARGFYTFTNSEDTNDDKVLGIPEHVWGLDVAYRFLKKFKLLVRGTFNGKYDFNVFLSEPTFTVVRAEADHYFKVDAVLSCDVTENAEVYVRAENIFDDEIQENGFDGIPAVVFGGIKVKI